MASNDEDLCTSHADFAVICSFVENFGEKLGLTLPNIGELQSSLEDTDNVSPIVSQCVSQLLRRINKSVKLDRWERGLQRFAHTYSHQDGWELERFGFKKAKLEVKIRVIKTLLEAQFDMYKSFKDKVNSLSANELRLQPCGRDKKGVSYWCQLDECANLRVYSDDQDEETWTLVASTREELVTLISGLESESPPGASREMSVEGSHSGTATPVGLSEAPTPVDSKAPTPIPSGRTSPVLDTGQDKEIDKKDGVDDKKVEKDEERVTQKLEMEKELLKVEVKTNVDTECKSEKEKLPGEVMDVLDKNKKVLNLSQSEVPKHKGGTGDTEKKDSDRPEENYTKLSLTSEEVEEKQTSKDVGKTQEQKLNNEGKRRTEEETDEKKVDSTTEKVTENEKDTDKVENVDEVKEQLITECKSKMAECEDDKNRKKIEIPSEVESCEKENLKKETVIKTEAAENTIEKTDKVKSELINEAAENTNKKTDKVKSELENETAENTNEKTDKVKSALKYETAENTQEKTDKVKSELEYETAENTNEKTDKVKSALKNETAESSNEKTDKVKSALKNETAENTDGKTEKFKSKLKNEVAEHTDGKTDKLKSDLKNEEAKNTDGKTDKLKSELEKKVETADQKVPSNEDIEESEKNGNKSRNRDEDSKEKEKTTKVQIKHAESTEVEGGPSQKGAHVEQQKSLSTENVAEATEKKVEEVVCGKKSGKMLETMEVDDNTKEICLDIAAKKTMLVRERGSQEILESKGPKFGLIERTETKKKESVWDKLNKMKEKGEAKSEETGERKKETNPCLPLSADKHPKEEEKQEHSSHSTPKEDARIKSSNTTFTIQRAWEDKVTTKPGPSVLSESSLAPPKQQQQQAPKLMSIESLVGPPTRPLNLPSQPVPAVIRSSIGGLQPTTKDDMTEPPLKKFKFSDMSSLESHSESRVSDSKFTQETSPSDPPPLPPSPALPPQAAKGDKDRITQKNEIEEKVVSLSSIRSVESEEKVYQKDDAKLSAQSENPAQDRPDKNRTYNSGDERHPEAGGSHSTVEGEMTQQEKTEESKGKNKDHNPTVEAVSKIDTRIPGKEVKITETVITAAVESKIECQVTDSVKSTTQKPYDNPLEEVKEDSSSGAIEEPVMLIKGDGEGAMCEGGNDLFHSQDFFPALAQPWWEHFGENNATRASVGETIEEGVMYFWGEGTGAECEAGNNGDETETSSDTNKQGEGGGSGGTVATDSQRNTAVADLKTAKEVEDIKTDGDVKAVDGVCEGDEAKVNGLRTVESVDKTTDKSESQDDQSNEVSDAKHASVNGKKVNEENSVCDEHDDGLQLKASGGCEKIMVKEVKEEEKKRANTEQILSVTQESKKCKSDISDNVKVEGCEVKSNEEEKERRKNKKETVKDKDGSEEEGIGDEEEIEEEEEGDVEEEEEEEEEVDEEDEDEEERRSKKKHKEKLGSSYMKKQVQHDSAVGQQGTMRGRGRPHKRNAEQQESEEEEDDQEEDYHDEDDDGPEGDENEQYHTMPPARKRRQRGKGSTSRPLPDVPRQKSARIAKIREKEEQERRELEAIRLNQLAEENRMREIKKKAREERRSQREMKKGRREKKEKKDREKKKRKKKKRGKKKKNVTDPWDHSSSSSSSSSEEEEDLEEDEEEYEKLVFKSDHEFSPESDLEEDAQPIKRARTAKKLTRESEVEAEGDDDDAEEEDDEDETQCTKCGHDDHPETILLCDNCDAGWHLSCLRPPLLSVPEGDWICPTCEHVQLVKKLRALLHEFDECQKRAQNEELRRQRLAYVNVSMSNVLPEGKKKKKHRGDGEEDDDDDGDSDSDSDDEDSDSESDDSSDSSSQSSSDSTAPLYTLRARSARTLKEQVENFDEMINEAIRDEMEAAAGAGNAGRGKDIENIMETNEEEIVENEGLLEEQEEGKPEEDQKSKEVTHQVVKEECEGKREREKDEDEDEDEVAPKRKKPKPTEEGTGDDDNYKDSEEDHAESESEEDVKTSKRRRHMLNISIKKRRRLTDLDAEDDDDASDEDFMNSSEEEEDETEESLESSSSISTDLGTDDSDLVDMKRRRSSRCENLPLRRSARNRRGDEDSENEERIFKKQKNKKKKKRRHSSSEEDEELSSDSDGSYRKKKVKRRKRPILKTRGKKGNKGRSRKKLSKSKPKPKKETAGEDGGEDKKPSKPRIKYAKPPKPKQEDNEDISQRRVTRGRQVNYYDALMMSDETEEEEEPKKKWRGKVMKGERIPTESSEYEASDDERMKRRGVSGGLGKGKVMKGEEEDEEKLDRAKKKRGRPKKEELLGKPSILKVATLDSTPASVVHPVQSLPTASLPVAKTETAAPAIPPVTQTAVISVPSVQVTPALLSAAITPSSTGVSTPPATALTVSADSPSHNIPEPAAGTPPTPPAPAAPNKGQPTTITPAAASIGSSSPIHQPVGKWSPHLSGVGGTPSTPPRSGGAPGSATPPRPGLPAAPVTASPPPPYRSSPLPMTQGGPGIPACSSAPSNITPGGPPPTTSTLSQVYSPYRPPPEHFPAHPAFPGYAPPGRHSPSPHTTSRHPVHLPPGHALPRMPPNYGPPPLTSVPGQGPYPSRGISSHPGVLRGPPHDLYRAPPGSLPGHGSPSHPGHPHLIMKPGYPGLEPLPYSGSPGPSPLSLHQGSQGSPAHQSPSEDSKEETHPSGKGPGEFSSGLMSYFSSQRDDDIE